MGTKRARASAKVSGALALSVFLLAGFSNIGYSKLYPGGYTEGERVRPFTEEVQNSPTNELIESDTENEFHVGTLAPTPLAIGVWNAKATYIATEGNNEVIDDERDFWGIFAGDHDDDHYSYWNNSREYSELTLKANKGSNIISGLGTPRFAVGAWVKGRIELIAGTNNEVTSGYTDIYANDDSIIKVIAGKDNILNSTEKYYAGVNVTASYYSSDITIESYNGNNVLKATGTTLSDSAVDSQRDSSLKIIADNGSNTIEHPYVGIHVSNNGVVDVKAKNDNTIVGANEGSFSSLFARQDTNSAINVISEEGSNTLSADITGIASDGGKISVKAGKINTIQSNGSSIYGGNSGDVEVISNKTNNINSHNGMGIEALEEAKVRVVSERNIISAKTVGVSALSKSNVDITGVNVVKADTDGTAFESGTEAVVNDNYCGNSSVEGNIVAYDKGTVNVRPADTINSSVEVKGNISSYKDGSAGGIVNVDLNNNSIFTGAANTADNYDAEYGTSANGIINIRMSREAFWNMENSSSVTNLSGTGTVIFTHGGDSLKVDNITESKTYKMDLSIVGTDSDMLYVKNSDHSKQTLIIKNADELRSSMSPNMAVRFATFADGNDEFTDGTVIGGYVPAGIYNDSLIVRTRDVNNDPDNTTEYNNAYNGDGTRKPTAETVANLYYAGDNPQNVYIVKERKINDGAKTPAVNSKLTYRYFTDMDTFTKRSGQAEYFTAGADQGWFIRTAHNKVGVDDIGSVSGNTFELGYTDVGKNNDEYKHRWQVAGSFQRLTGSYENISGNLKVKDGYLAYYDTKEYYDKKDKRDARPEYKRNEHDYWDSYLKVHYAKTYYDVNDQDTNLLYKGDYDQWIVNLSTEYGRKIALSHSWSIVPQVQLQVSYIDGYSYTDSQGLYTKADHCWSILGRLGFDLAKDINTESDMKFYLKASILHEFMDDADIITTFYGPNFNTLKTKGDSDGTWGAVGVGFSGRLQPDQFFFIDAETYFGNDFDDTFSVRAGLALEF
jgi:hypothetical protein